MENPANESRRLRGSAGKQFIQIKNSVKTTSRSRPSMSHGETSTAGVHQMRLLHRHSLYHYLLYHLMTLFPQKRPYTSFENNTGQTDLRTDGRSDGHDLFTWLHLEMTTIRTKIHQLWLTISGSLQSYQYRDERKQKIGRTKRMTDIRKTKKKPLLKPEAFDPPTTFKNSATRTSVT